jgi:hypothetical protein
MRVNDNDYHERFLAKGQELHEAGDKSELLRCLNHCLWFRQPIPDWVRNGIRLAYALASSHQVKSWDEVFGRPLKKGKQLATEHGNFRIRFKLLHAVEKRHEAGEPLDDELFTSVGEKFDVGKTVAREIYYSTLAERLRTREDRINRVTRSVSSRKNSGKLSGKI